MVQSLFQNVTKVTFTTSVVIAVLLLLLPLIYKNYTVKWRYWVWLVLAVRLLIPFSPSLMQTPIEITPASQNIEFKVPVQNMIVAPLSNNTAVPQAAKNSTVVQTITLNEILSIVWVLGIAVFMLYHLTGYFLFKRSVWRFSRPVEDKQTTGLWGEVKEEMRISQNIRLLACKKVQSPMMTGFLKPLLLLPDLDYSATDLKIILKHELIHYKRKDIWYKLLLVCANTVHWFNPLVYLMTAMSNKDIEMVCDSELIRDSDTTFRKQYSETILSAIHKGNLRQTAFSTYFYGDKRTMKERFANIFDMSKKRKGIIALCAIIIAVGVAGASVAYGVSDKNEQETINNIALHNAGNTYYLENGKFIISYGIKKSAVVPLEPGTDDQSSYFEDKAVYISDEVTAVAYGGNTSDADATSPVTVLISNDEGQTWKSYSVADTATGNYMQRYIGFTTKNDGWLLLGGDVAMGHQENRIFETLDGGKTWNEIGNTNAVYPRVVTGAGFASKNIGFVSFRYDTDPNPVVYRTEDKGKVWIKCAFEIPESFKSIATYATALSPVFNGENGVLPVTFRNNESEGDPVDVQVNYVTSDYGKTWTFNEKYNFALIWADAWKTRNGKIRYEIMSSQMQADFRVQQQSPDNFVIRWSSPWVESYGVTMDGEQAIITYWYTDSTASTYKGVERLTFGEENGRMVVTDCKTEIDMEEYADMSGWKTVDAGLYTFSMPQEWEADVLSVGSVSFTKNGEGIGSLTAMGYDSSLPLSQFEGNHAQTLSTEPLKGCKYPATKVIIRRTQPAAANDDSYVDELHIYLVPENSKFAYDLYFDSSQVNEKAIVIAKSVILNTTRIQIQDIAEKWAEAVKNRDGKAQYALLSAELKKKVYDEYKDLHWVTGVSSPWVDGFKVKPGDKTAVISYTYRTSDGFAGYYRQTLSFAMENGQLMVSDYTEPKQADGQSKNTVLAYLEDSKTWLSAAFLREGMFSDMTLSIDGKTKSFPWKTYGETAFLPELSYADVDGDRRNELIIILCEDEGTGIFVEEIHVLNPEDFSEITVQNPLDALKKRFVSKIDESGVKITIDNQNALVFPEKEITAQVAEKESWASNLTMGSIVDYAMKDNHVVAGVAAQLSSAGFLGNFNLTYEYRDHGLKVSTIVFSSNIKR